MRGANAAFVLGWEAPGVMRGRRCSKPARGMELELELGGQGPAGGLRETVSMGMRALHMGKEHALS